MTAVGGQPVSIAFPEVYSALERGVADCAVTGTGSGNAAKWYEVTTHIYNLAVSWAVSAYYVNIAWWNKLDQPTRDLVAQTMKEVEDAQWKLGADASQDGHRLQRRQGGYVQDPHPGEDAADDDRGGQCGGQGRTQEDRRDGRACRPG